MIWSHQTKNHILWYHVTPPGTLELNCWNWMLLHPYKVLEMIHGTWSVLHLCEILECILVWASYFRDCSQWYVNQRSHELCEWQQKSWWLNVLTFNNGFWLCWITWYHVSLWFRYKCYELQLCYNKFHWYHETWHGYTFHIIGPLWVESTIYQCFPHRRGQWCYTLMFLFC